MPINISKHISPLCSSHEKRLPLLPAQEEVFDEWWTFRLLDYGLMQGTITCLLHLGLSNIVNIQRTAVKSATLSRKKDSISCFIWVWRVLLFHQQIRLTTYLSKLDGLERKCSQFTRTHPYPISNVLKWKMYLDIQKLFLHFHFAQGIE